MPNAVAPNTLAIAAALIGAALGTTLTACTVPFSSPVVATPAAGRSVLLEIAPALRPCMGMVSMKCLQIRRSANDPWELFHGPIAGFSHEPGYTYQIEVIETQVSPVPADASALAYTLKRIISKRRTG